MAAAQGVTYGGNLDATDVYTKSDKAGIRLDWNINDKQKLSFRWSLVSARQMNSASTALNLNATDYSYDFVSKTSSFVAELQSRLSDRMDNELRVSYVRVRDRREPGAPFPMVQVNNVGDGILNLGNDRSSMANTLDQDIWSFTDNLTYTAGKHTLVMGTHNEFYHFSNLFIQDAFGSYFLIIRTISTQDESKNTASGRQMWRSPAIRAGRLHSGPECWDFMCRTISAQRIGST